MRPSSKPGKRVTVDGKEKLPGAPLSFYLHPATGTCFQHCFVLPSRYQEQYDFS
jgi:hypothetical protein